MDGLVDADGAPSKRRSLRQRGRRILLEIEPGDTVKSFKVAAAVDLGALPSDQHIFFRGEELADDAVAAELPFVDNDRLFVWVETEDSGGELERAIAASLSSGPELGFAGSSLVASRP
jgi:hypothetical protein